MSVNFKSPPGIYLIINRCIYLLFLLTLPDMTGSAVTFSLNNVSGSMIFQYKSENQIDISQAELMLTYLDNDFGEQPDSLFLDKIMKAKGTELIIRQMNLARKVSHAQYRTLLAGFSVNRLPSIQPVDSTERAQRGIDGLVNNVWPLLQWGKQNTTLLKQKLNEFKKLDVYDNAQKIASNFLPRSVNITPSLYIVMGGRAGFAALHDNDIYFDLLVMTFSRIRKGVPQISQDEITEFFAHEMHHLGLSRILAEKQNTLNMNTQEELIFRVLSSLVSEGSATYLINGHRDINSIRDNPSYSEYFKDINNLLMTYESILNSIDNNEIKTNIDFEEATASLLGHSYHSAGSHMLSIIDQASGLESIMSILDDPRQLLSIYNNSVQKLNQVTNPVYLFDDDLAGNVAVIGE